MGQNLYHKVFDRHCVAQLPSGQFQLFIGLHLIHEVTSPQAFAMVRDQNLSVPFPKLTFATVDHIMPTTGKARQRPLLDPLAEEMLQHIEQNTADFGINFFSPDKNEIYPPGFSTYVTAPDVAKRWEGECRTGHFQGVVTVVLKLFTLIQPQAAFFGEKDYQQLQVIRQMVRDLNVPVEIFGCPLIREQNGLAMSSRNRNMSASESLRALSLFQSLEQAKQQVRMGNRNSESLMASIVKTLEEAPVDRIQYVAIVDPESLEPIDSLQSSAQVLIAVQIGATRLIDNTRIELPAATGYRSDDISAEES